MIASADRFRRAMVLAERPAEYFDRAFVATSQFVPWPKAYGGDMVAQAALAAMLTVTDDRVLHSLHSYFLRAVDIDAEIRYEVELVRDGRGYSTRQVRGYQNGQAAYVSLASFHVPEDGDDYAPSAPALPPPEDLPTSAQYLNGRTGAAADYWSHGRSFDMRHVPGPLYFQLEGDAVPYQAVWVRAFDALPDDPNLHRAAIAYVCDYTILEPVLRVLGMAWAEPGLMTASLDHAMWFHRAARADDWLLYAQEAAAAQRSRGLGIGRFFTRTGELVATVAQEGMLRRRGRA